MDSISSDRDDDSALERVEHRDPEGPVVLVILDGVGHGPRDDFDAVHVARTPNLDGLLASSLHLELAAHGTAVGLPSDADMGNSEVGHNTMGTGRILDQGATRINKALESGEIWSGYWRELVDRLQDRDGTLHLIGLLSDGNVHSHVEHLYAFLAQGAADGLSRARVHVLLDGRDVDDRSAERYLEQLEHELASHRSAGRDYSIASGGGRMRITMDRYGADWEMVRRGWRVHVLGDAPQFDSALAAVAAARAAKPSISDQFLPEFVVADETGAPVGAVHDGDAVVTFNFRGDRITELCQAFLFDEFPHFERERRPEVDFAGLVLYDGESNMPPRRLVEPERVDGTVSELLARAGVTQFAVSETQKFGHVTYFWNGNRSDPFDRSTETYLDIPSDVVPFEQRPWMKSAEIADAVIDAVASERYQFVRCNLAGGDMVGHTGFFDATVVALEAIDLALGRIAESVRGAKGCLIVTADHGNAEDMVLRKGDAPLRAENGEYIYKTSHSLKPVPLIVQEYGRRRLEWSTALPERPGLSHLASTICLLLGFEPPDGFDQALLARPASRPAAS